MKLAGRVEKLVLVSNMVSYGPEPREGEEIEQRATLRADGRSCVTRYAYAPRGDLVRIESRRPRCSADEAKRILADVLAAFVDREVMPMVTDVPVWEMTLELEGGGKIEAHGSVLPGDDELDRISESLRRVLDMPCLFAFDGAPYYGDDLDEEGE